MTHVKFFITVVANNVIRFGLLKNATKRMLTDGLNSLVYKVLATEELPTHLRIQVLINENDILKVSNLSYAPFCTDSYKH